MVPTSIKRNTTTIKFNAPDFLVCRRVDCFAVPTPIKRALYSIKNGDAYDSVQSLHHIHEGQNEKWSLREVRDGPIQGQQYCTGNRTQIWTDC